jgi:hypothetical protein
VNEEKREFLVNDVLMFEEEIDVELKPPLVSNRILQQQEQPEEEAKKFLHDFGSLLEKHEFCDVIFIAGPKKKEFPAHRCILAARSPVFYAMFTCGLKESSSSFSCQSPVQIGIPDFPAETIQHLLAFIYTNELRAHSFEEASLLLQASEKYGLDSLKHLCATVLLKNLDASNLAQAIILSDQYHLDIRPACESFAKEHVSEVLSNYADVVRKLSSSSEPAVTVSPNSLDSDSACKDTEQQSSEHEIA